MTLLNVVATEKGCVAIELMSISSHVRAARSEVLSGIPFVFNLRFYISIQA